MPYIGNSQVAGVHQNNFKILDDISSYTETFDGSSSSVVNTTNNTITVSQHRFYHGQRVTYNNGGGSNIGGLASGTVYYAVADSHSTLKLAASLADALSNQVINISSVGSGTSHTLNNSFDGVNTKFKLTHSGGNGVNLTNASHATVAINNVIQRPNLNDTSFTEGFAIEGGKNIVFKVAPTSTDTFWGNTIAESVGTFDSTDHAIDTFTADGTTTNFNLIKIPPSIRDIHITLDGVTQHTSAFSLQGNVLVFSTAPTNGTAIQVKHMGFVGATASGVTGFYGRIGNVALQDGDTLRGDGSLITGIDASIAGINTAGISTFFNVGIGGTVGITSHVDLPQSARLRFGGKASGVDGLQIFNKNTGSQDYSFISSNDILFLQTSLGPTITLSNVQFGKYLSFTSTDSFYVKTNILGTNAKIIETDTAKVKLNYLGNTKLQTSGIGITVTGEADINGNLNVSGVSTIANVDINQGSIDGTNIGFSHRANALFNYVDIANDVDIDDTTQSTNTTTGALKVDGGVGIVKNLNVGGDLDVNGHTNLDNVSIAGVSTFAGTLSAANYAGLKVEQGGLNTTYASLSGTFNYEFVNGHVLTYTAATSSNYTPNFRVDSSTTLASKMNLGDVVSATLFVASSSHYCGSSVQVDGTTTNVTTEWVGGSAPSAANGSGYDIYSFTIVKTASTPAYTVFANAISAA